MWCCSYLCNGFCKLELSVCVASHNDSLINSDQKNSIPYCFKLKCNILYIYIYIRMMFKTVPFNLHESNFQSLMMHADYVTVVGFRVTFWDNLCQTFFLLIRELRSCSNCHIQC